MTVAATTAVATLATLAAAATLADKRGILGRGALALALSRLVEAGRLDIERALAAVASPAAYVALGVVVLGGGEVLIEEDGDPAASLAEVCHYCGNNPNPRQGHDCGRCGGN